MAAKKINVLETNWDGFIVKFHTAHITRLSHMVGRTERYRYQFRLGASLKALPLAKLKPMLHATFGEGSYYLTEWKRVSKSKLAVTLVIIERG